LTKEEEKILDGEKGEVLQKAMEILVSIGDIYDAECLVRIKSAHISGISYTNIGDVGVNLLCSFSKEKVKVRTTCNPACLDLESKFWREKVGKEIYDRQIEIKRILEKMNVCTTFTCTPYLVGNKPSKNDIIAWSESSAVIFANSVLGAKTNKESGITALAAALIGKTPKYGFLLDENRKPDVKIIVRTKLTSISDYSALGFFVGRELKESNIPLFIFKDKPTIENLKSLGAGLAIAGNIAMFICNKDSKEKIEVVEVEEGEIKEIYEEFYVDNPELICLGCPHASLNEMKRYLRICGRKWIFLARDLLKTRKIEKKECFVCDTCLAVSPILRNLNVERIATNSTKLAFLVRNLHNVESGLIKV